MNTHILTPLQVLNDHISFNERNLTKLPKLLKGIFIRDSSVRISSKAVFQMLCTSIPFMIQGSLSHLKPQDLVSR